MSLIYRPENVKEMQKLFLFELVRQFFSVLKRNQRIWLKLLRNIAIKLAAGEVTKLCAILQKICKNPNFELTIWKNMQQNVRINIHVKMEPIFFILIFEIWIYVKSFYYFFSIFFKGSRKIELKTQLTLVSKKKYALNFADMENPLCTNSSFINSLQNKQAIFDLVKI